MKKIFLILLFFIVITPFTKAAYEPFEPDAIKVTNTLDADINQLPQTQFNNINTTAIYNTNTDIFTSVTTNGVVCEPGVYLVDIVLYHTTTSARTNPAIEVTVDGVSTGIRGANGYIRVGSGHNESSTTVTDMVELSSTAKIGFDTLELSAAGTVPAPAGASSMTIVRFHD